MLVDAATFPSFIKPCRVSDRIVGDRQRWWDSIRRRWDAYKTMREVRSGLLSLSPITEDEHTIFFDVEPSKTYNAVKLAVDNDLVWSTSKKAIDYRQSVERWCQMLEHDEVPVERIERIQRNDLNEARFGDFKITLMEYLISCERRGRVYYRISGFQAITPSS